MYLQNCNFEEIFYEFNRRVAIDSNKLNLLTNSQYQLIKCKINLKEKVINYPRQIYEQTKDLRYTKQIGIKSNSYKFNRSLVYINKNNHINNNSNNNIRINDYKQHNQSVILKNKKQNIESEILKIRENVKRTTSKIKANIVNKEKTISEIKQKCEDYLFFSRHNKKINDLKRENLIYKDIYYKKIKQFYIILIDFSFKFDIPPSNIYNLLCENPLFINKLIPIADLIPFLHRK